MGNLFRTGGGSNKMNFAVDAKNIVTDEKNKKGTQTIRIVATKDMKKALLVAAASTAQFGGKYVHNVLVASNRTLKAIPGAYNGTTYVQLSYDPPSSALSAACIIYIVEDIKKGDWFSVEQHYDGAIGYKNLTLICLD